MRALAVLLLTLLLLPMAPLAGAQAPRELVWEYHVGIPDPASGLVRVEVRFLNLDGVVTHVTLLTAEQDGLEGALRPGPGTETETAQGGLKILVDDPVESVSYDVRPERDAFNENGKLAWVGEDFALFKAEAFALAFTYQYYQGEPFEWQARVVLEPPAGWDAAGPWNRTAQHTYALPPGEILPRGYVVFGPFARVETHDLGAKTLTYVRMDEQSTCEGSQTPYRYEEDMVEYLTKASPYYEAVYGPGTGPNLLVVSTGAPMFRGGLGASDSLYVHPCVDLGTLAHEYAHVHQLFGTSEEAGRSAIWFNEGDADYHSALSLFAAGFWSPDEVNEFLDELASDRDEPSLSDVALVDATYSHPAPPHDKFAYHKGATVLRALDALLARESEGAIDLGDLLRRLNEKHRPGAQDQPQRVTNEEILQEANALLGKDLALFFERYVHGTQWPSVEPFVPSGGLALSDLVLEPPRAAPGEPVVARVRAANSGTQSLTEALALQVGGVERDATSVTLGVGESRTVELRFVAPPPGEHEVRIGYLKGAFHSLLPPALHVDRVSFVPSSVRAGEEVTLLAFVQNAGEQPGRGHLEVLVEGVEVARSPEVFVEAGVSESVALPLTLARAGPTDVVVRVVTPLGNDERVSAILVGEADRDRDGVPDTVDAYPLNPRIAQGSVVNDARDSVPLPLALVVVALALAARARRA